MKSLSMYINIPLLVILIQDLVKILLINNNLTTNESHYFNQIKKDCVLTNKTYIMFSHIKYLLQAQKNL